MAVRMKFIERQTSFARPLEPAARALYVVAAPVPVQVRSQPSPREFSAKRPAEPHMNDQTPPEAVAAPAETPARRPLTPEAQRALAEAQERRRAAEAAGGEAPREINGRGGLDPVRYGDWEVKGLTSDF